MASNEVRCAYSEALNALDVAKRCESPALRLSKYVKIGGESKKNEVEFIVACANKNMCLPEPFTEKGERIVATLKSRLIVNQAGGILENAGLCLHPHFGYPYIPGSAVKGLARHAAWCEWNAEKDEAKKREIASEIVAVFGYPTGDETLDSELKSLEQTPCRGSICFLAAVPEEKVKLTSDVLTCHHKKYYSPKEKQSIALDNEEPNIQFFPTVKEGSKFTFQLLSLRESTNQLLAIAKKWLIKAITLYGIGAKTAAGYGWFSYVDISTLRPDEAVIQSINQRFSSQTKLKEFVKNKAEWESTPQFRYSLLCCVQRKDFWNKWRKNMNSKEMTHLNEIAEEFGVSL